MSFFDPTLIKKLQTNLSYLSERQTLLAKNISNIDTPNYRAQDLKKLDFSKIVQDNTVQLPMRMTSKTHIQPSFSSNRYQVDTRYDAVESKPGGNNVVLEEQMGHISDTSANHQLSSTLLRKYNDLYRVAVANKV